MKPRIASTCASLPNFKRWILFAVATLILTSVGLVIARYRFAHANSRQWNALPVAMVLKATENPFWKEVREGALTEAKKVGIDLVVDSTINEWEFDQQIALVRSYLDRGVKALILAPNDQERLAPAIRDANARNIPVIIIDVPISDQDLKRQNIRIVSQICSDNEKGGSLAAQYIAKRFEGAIRVGLISGRDPENTYLHSRENGFIAEIKKYPRFTLSHMGHADWSRERAKDLSETWLKEEQPPDVIFAASDHMALGVLDAIQATAYSKPLKVIGYDATREGQRAILDDTLLASISQDPMKMGALAVEFAAKHLRGKSVPSQAYTPVTLVYGVREIRSTEVVVN